MTLPTFSNQHLIHITHLDPQLGKILVKFLHDSDPSHFGSLSYSQHEIGKNAESMEKFEKDFSKVLNHIESSDLVFTWNRQDMISNIKTLNNFVSDDIPLILLDIEWTKQLLCYAQFLYRSRNEYIKTQKLLLTVIGITAQPDLILAAYWGMLQCNILLKDWDTAWSNIIFINELLSSKADAFSPVNIHLNREWLMTAALFILSSHPDGASTLGSEFFMQSSQLNTILCGCQYLFRYVISFVLMSRKKKSFIKELFKFMQHESLKSLNDPIIKLFHTCLITYNFEATREILENWKQAIKLDYFLHPLESELLDGTRTIIFDTYCKLHRHIQIDSMVHRLCLDKEYSNDDSEVWIVKAIQRSKIDAKIDSENGVILIQSKHPIPYHHVIEKTKSQNLRTQMMVIHLDSVSTASNVTRS